MIFDFLGFLVCLLRIAGGGFLFAAAPAPHFFVWYFLAPVRAVLRDLGGLGLRS